MEAFLDSLSTKSTRSTYKRGVELFTVWYGKDVDTILAERKNDLTPRPKENMIEARQRANRYEKLLEQFYNWLEKEGYDKTNTRYSYCKGLLQLFRYYSMGLTLRNASPINQTEPKIDAFPLKPEHTKKMFHSAKDLRSKLLVSLGNDLGWRISDVLSIKREELPNLNQESPIEWLRMTSKENEVAKTCLSKTTIILLKEYMFAFPNEHNPYLFFSNGGVIDEDTVNCRLRDLAQDSGIKLGNLSLSWHCFRKMIISTAKNLSIDPDIIKLMTGKAVEKSMLPYLNGIDVKSAFTKLQTTLGINALSESSEDVTKSMSIEITKLENALLSLEQENKSLKTRIEVLQQHFEGMKKQMADFEEFKATVEKKLGIKEKVRFD